MTPPVHYVCDASALLANLRGETGGETVGRLLPYCLFSALNIAEVAAFFIRNGMEPQRCVSLMEAQGLTVIPFDTAQGYLTASLITHTKPYGLSLSDRACLALAKQRELPVLTADKIWAKLDLGIEIQVIR